MKKSLSVILILLFAGTCLFSMNKCKKIKQGSKLIESFWPNFDKQWVELEIFVEPKKRKKGLDDAISGLLNRLSQRVVKLLDKMRPYNEYLLKLYAYKFMNQYYDIENDEKLNYNFLQFALNETRRYISRAADFDFDLLVEDDGMPFIGKDGVFNRICSEMVAAERSHKKVKPN